MPHSGYIKRFVLEDFGINFFYDDNGAQTTFLIFIEKHLVLMFRFHFLHSFYLK